MSAHVVLGPGMKLVASVVFHVRGPLFVTLLGPAGVSFGAGWQTGPQEIENTSGDVWQFTVVASRMGPLGSEVPVAVVSQSGGVTQIAALGLTGALATLTVSVTKVS